MFKKILLPLTAIEGIEVCCSDMPTSQQNIHDVFAKCQTEDYEAAFMPLIVDARIVGLGDSRIWQKFYTTQSIEVIGKTKQGNRVAVYAHIPHYFSNPDKVKEPLSSLDKTGIGRMPAEEFLKLLELDDGENVFVVDYDKLENAKSEEISFEEALTHPRIVPFFGGKKRTEAYVKRHFELFEASKMRVNSTRSLDRYSELTAYFLGIPHKYSWSTDYIDCIYCEGGNFIKVPRKSNI